MTSLSDEPAEAEVPPEPAWDVARLFPAQGQWGEGDYLALTTNHLVEFSDGRIEVLPMPTLSHQLVLAFLYARLLEFVAPGGLGLVLFAAFRVRLGPGQYREPDLMFMKSEHAARCGEMFWDGADLVMEVVSENRAHDLETKRFEYARAGIPEYWIVDPREGRITVLRLDAGSASYTEHGAFGRGERATSVLLPGFEIEVAEALRPRR